MMNTILAGLFCVGLFSNFVLSLLNLRALKSIQKQLEYEFYVKLGGGHSENQEPDAFL
jgi:hypothetical protein